MVDGSRSRTLVLQTLIILLSSTLLLTLLWWYVFSNDAARQWWLNLELTLEQTPILHAVGERAYALGVERNPGPVLIGAAPYFPIFGFMVLLFARIGRGAGPNQPVPLTRAGIRYAGVMQFLVVYVIVSRDLLQGLPLCSALLGSRILYEPVASLACAVMIMAVISLSIAIVMRTALAGNGATNS